MPTSKINIHRAVQRASLFLDANGGTMFSLAQSGEIIDENFSQHLMVEISGKE